MLPAPLLLPLFLAGGAAALIDEVTWFQLLALHAGGTSRAMAAVLATFMAGLGAGAILAPRLGRSRRPMVVCAVLEAAIGVCALAMPALLPAIGRLPPALQAPGFTLALLAPAVAMGATLPVAARALGSGRAAARAVGWLYAANTLGGVIGCLLAGFWLLRVHDTAVAARVAAGTSGLAAAWALMLATRSAPAEAEAARSGARRDPDAAPPPLDHALLVVSCLSGMTALAAEVVWTRLLALLLGGTTYTFSLILACFLAGIAIGAAIAATLAPPRGWLAWCHAALVPAIAFGAWAAGVGLPAWPIDPRLSASPWVQLQIDLVRCLVVVLPAAILWGASLPLCIAAAVRDGRADAPRAAAAVLAANTLGAVLGSLAAAILLLPGAGSLATTQWVVVVAALAALVALPPRRRGAGGAARFLAPGLALALAAILVPRLPALAPSLVGWGRYAALYRGEPSEFLVVREGADSTLAVSRNLVGTLNYHNAGKVQASGEPQDMRLQRMLGHIVTLVPEAPRRVLVIGCGAGVTAGSVSVDPEVEEETICEIEAEVPRTAGEYFTSINDGVIDNPKVRVRIDDARRFLRETEGTFDAITSDPFDPWVRGAANLYTEEFFTLAKRRLSPGGAITVFVQLYEAGTPAVKSEIATFLRVFPEGLVFGNTAGGEGYDLVLLGTNGPTRIDLDRIDARIHAPGAERLRDSLAAIGCDGAAELFASYAAAGPQLGLWLSDAQINRDANLRLQYLAGLGVNAYEQAPIYRAILGAGAWPEGIFTGSPERLERLEQLGRQARF